MHVGIGNPFQAFLAHAQPAILRIWLEAHAVSSVIITELLAIAQCDSCMLRRYFLTLDWVKEFFDEFAFIIEIE